MSDASVLIKAAALLKSFVAEEVAATHLLDLSWKAVSTALKREVGKVIDFKNRRLIAGANLDTEVWHDQELINLVDSQWAQAEPGLRKYLTIAWNKGVRGDLVQKVEGTHTVTQVDVLMSSLAFFYRNHLWNNIKPDVERLVHMLQTVPDMPNEAFRAITDGIDLVLKSEDYMATLGNLYVARAHHFGMIEYMEQNGIKKYKISAVLDNRTCNTCIQLDGTMFTLDMAQTARDTYNRHANDLEALKGALPFVTYNSIKDLEPAQISERVNLALPPRHPGCRCILVPV